MSIYLKKATIKDIPIISELFYNYYHDFDIFKVSNKKKRLQQAFHKLCHLNTIMNVKNNNCYLCLDNGKVVGSFVLLSPNDYQKPLSETIVRGGFSLWWNCATIILNPCLPIIGSLLNKLKDAESVLLKEDMHRSWYLDALVIKRKPDGSMPIINDIITKIKYGIQQDNNGNLKLLVNNDEQLNYFIANKFEIIRQHIVKGKKFSNPIWLLSSGVKK
ncbi:hypothetical protein LH61_06365 [Leuconostoc mesenteroides P45]|uniref:hypothetical protein n=1 Tax=Leuconostoc mesenteroides TaxID=1245 RepID=UPI000504460A|nr:hypothetical protein [Leuconostoc mesenteroides]KGB51094.1 hypothetical protein LH61_06365 [Leuconostoc mesenteroides P45]